MGTLTPPAEGLVLHDLSIGEMDALALHGVLRLRCAVFIVEQACLYADVDGRDAEPTTRHVWLADDDEGPVAYLRRLREPDGSARIGRVVTAPAWRGLGLAARLVRTALPDEPVRTVLDAQSHLRAFYERLGFAVAGPEFIEDGIPHLPMRRG